MPGTQRPGHRPDARNAGRDYHPAVGWNARLSNDAFVADYTRAREEGAHTEFDKLRDVEDEVRLGKIDPQQGRVIIDSIKWRLSKQLPRTYGDKQTIEHEGEVKMKATDHAPDWILETIAEAEAEQTEH